MPLSEAAGAGLMATVDGSLGGFVRLPVGAGVAVGGGLGLLAQLLSFVGGEQAAPFWGVTSCSCATTRFSLLGFLVEVLLFEAVDFTLGFARAVIIRLLVTLKSAK